MNERPSKPERESSGAEGKLLDYASSRTPPVRVPKRDAMEYYREPPPVMEVGIWLAAVAFFAVLLLVALLVLIWRGELRFG